MTEAFGLSDVGCVRSNNEDCYRLEPDIGLYLLADGMGGAQAGERASETAVDTVADLVRQAPRRDSQVLVEAIVAANGRGRELASHDITLEGMGTTLVAVLDAGEELLVASVGDSRAYICDG